MRGRLKKRKRAPRHSPRSIVRRRRFFSNVSHEFRTPLTLLLGPIEEALRRGEGPDATRTDLLVAHRNALRLLKLVNSLLDFSRIEAGRMRAEYVPTDLAVLTTDLASAFRSAVERAGLRLTVNISPLPEPVFVDRDMWEKIVLNLLSNAFKHTFVGGITVDVEAENGGAKLRVTDTGVGIPAEQLPRIFERFHRVPNARSRTHEGTGIGLALVQELVRLHGGSIDAESNEGKGSAFTVRIPFGSAHLSHDFIGDASAPPASDVGTMSFVEEALRWLPDENESRDSKPTTDDASTIWSPLVLLADDNADMRDYVARLCRAQGWRVDAVSDGAMALEHARRDRPDVVLTDVMMPGLDGFELLRELRGDAATATIPIIMLSARAGGDSKVEGLDAGADDYLVKPFAANELVARVSSHLALSRLRRETETMHADEAQFIATLQRVGAAVTAELEREALVQLVTDEATRLTGAQFGAFFYNVMNDAGEAYTLYTISGVPREMFSRFPMPRNTKVFEPTFRGTGIVRSDDITKDPRYGPQRAVYGKPAGHLAGRQLSRRAGRRAIRRSARRFVFWSRRARSLYGPSRAAHRWCRELGRSRDRQRESLRSGKEGEARRCCRETGSRAREPREDGISRHDESRASHTAQCDRRAPAAHRDGDPRAAHARATQCARSHRSKPASPAAADQRCVESRAHRDRPSRLLHRAHRRPVGCD
jgi:DNA-binding response OmpR family regulator